MKTKNILNPNIFIMSQRSQLILKSHHFLCMVFVVSLFIGSLYSQENNEPEVKKLVLKGARIEGEMGSIKALIVTSEKRPDFSPMALQLAQKDIEIRNINKKVVTHTKYGEPFPVKLPK